MKQWFKRAGPAVITAAMSMVAAAVMPNEATEIPVGDFGNIVFLEVNV